MFNIKQTMALLGIANKYKKYTTCAAINLNQSQFIVIYSFKVKDSLSMNERQGKAKNMQQTGGNVMLN